MIHKRIGLLGYVYLTLVLAGIMLLGCSCSGTKAEADTSLSLYYLTNTSEAFREQTVLTPYEVTLSPQEISPDTLIKRLISPPNDTVSSPFPPGTQLLLCTMKGGVAYVDFSSAYGFLSGYDLTMSNYALCLTLTQLPQINTLVITVDGQPLPNWEQPSLRASDAILDSAEQEHISIEVALYFGDKQTTGLQAEYRTIFLEEETCLAKRIVTDLISGPESESLTRLLPRDTELLELTLEDGCCYLTLSKSFWDQVPSDQSIQQLTIDSIVNSLTNLESVKSVQFLCPDPSMQPIYGSLVLDHPLESSSMPIS